jgi:hypothetical protein
MATILVCKNTHIAALTKLTLERHWLYEGRGFLRNSSFRRQPAICLDINGPISPRLRTALERLEGVEVVEVQKLGGRHRDSYVRGG